MEITLRPATDADMETLYTIYASTREWEMSLTDWSDEQKEAFLRMQFNAQHIHYVENYPTAAFQMILADAQPAGRLYLDEWPGEIRIVDITLLPNYRNGGIGTTILREILRRGAAAGKPVRIHVEQFNPAMSLYERLGFAKVGEFGAYNLMERPPDPVTS